MSRLPAHRCSAPTSLSLLPSGVAITAEARKLLRGCLKTARDPVPLQLRGWARGSVPPPAHSPSTGHSCHPQPQHLCRARGGHAQGQCVPKTCSTSGMRQQGWDKQKLPSSGFSLPQCLPDPRRTLLGTEVRRWGKTPGEGERAASRGTAVPTPSQHSGMARNGAGEDAQAGWAELAAPLWGTERQRRGEAQLCAGSAPRRDL